MPLSQFDERTVFVSPGQLGTGTSAGSFQLASGTGYGTRIDQFLLSWNGAAALEVDIQLNDGFSDIVTIGTVTIAAAVGTKTSQVDVLAALFPVNQQFVIINAGGNVAAILKVSITGTEEFGWYLSGGNF